MKISTLIGSDKGGVGKSLIAQLVVAAHDNGGVPLKVAEVDHQHKLHSIFGDRVDLSLIPHSTTGSGAVGLRARGGFRFDQIYDVWASGNSLTDLGANITTPLLDWFKLADIGSLASRHDIVFRYIAIASPDDQAIRSATSGLIKAREALGEEAIIFLVLNDPGTVCGFEPYKETQAWAHLQAAIRSTRATTLEMQPCVSGIMEWGRALGHSPLALLKAAGSPALTDVQKRARWNEVEMQEHFREFNTWVRSVQRAIMPIFEAMRTTTPVSTSEETPPTVVPLRQSA